MGVGDWALNMSINKVKPSPVQHRPIPPNEFVREPPKVNPIFNDIRAILFVLKAAGMLPFYEEISSYAVGPPSKTHEFYSFFVCGITEALSIFNLYNLFTPGVAQLFYSYSDTDNVNKWLEILLCIMAHTTTVLFCLKNSKSYLKIINEILQVDEEVWQQYGATMQNNCGFALKFIVGIALCQWYLMIIKMLNTDDPLTPTSYIFIAYYSLQNGMSTIFIVFTAVLLRIVQVRFGFLNLVLQGYTYVQQRKLRRFVRRHGDALTGMETFPDDALFTYRLHNKLLRIYRAINECCSLILVGYMGYAFYTITTTTYNLFVLITTQRYISLNILQWCLAWLALHTSVLALLSRCCGQATAEANNTSTVLARIYGKSKDHQSIVDKYLTKSVKQEVQFTAYGFFVIDNSTLFKIFSAVTTYLVILIQFKQLEDSKIVDEMVEKVKNDTTLK